MAKGLLKSAAMEQAHRVFGFVDHFLGKDASRWTTVGEGTATVSAGRGGIITLATTNADNAETYLHTADVFQVVEGKAIEFEALVKFTDAAADAANVFVGLSSGAAADLLVDNGGGLKAGVSAVGFIKTDGSPNWSVIWADGAARKIEVLDAKLAFPKRDAMVAGNGNAQRLMIAIIPRLGKIADVEFRINNTGPIAKFLGVSYATAAAMAAVVGVKAGSAAIQNVLVDYVAVEQTV